MWKGISALLGLCESNYMSAYINTINWSDFLLSDTNSLIPTEFSCPIRSRVFSRWPLREAKRLSQKKSKKYMVRKGGEFQTPVADIRKEECDRHTSFGRCQGTWLLQYHSRSRLTPSIASKIIYCRQMFSRVTMARRSKQVEGRTNFCKQRKPPVKKTRCLMIIYHRNHRIL